MATVAGKIERHAALLDENQTAYAAAAFNIASWRR